MRGSGRCRTRREEGRSRLDHEEYVGNGPAWKSGISLANLLGAAVGLHSFGEQSGGSCTESVSDLQHSVVHAALHGSECPSGLRSWKVCFRGLQMLHRG
jgi:hypothetical protein